MTEKVQWTLQIEALLRFVSVVVVQQRVGAASSPSHIILLTWAVWITPVSLLHFWWSRLHLHWFWFQEGVFKRPAMIWPHYFDSMLSFISLIQSNTSSLDEELVKEIQSPHSALLKNDILKRKIQKDAFYGREDVLLAVKSIPLYFFPFDPSIKCFSQYGNENVTKVKSAIFRSFVDSLFGWEQYGRPFRAKTLTCVHVDCLNCQNTITAIIYNSCRAPIFQSNVLLNIL